MNVTIEASIGVGKSTLLRNLQAKLDIISDLSTAFFPEPVEHWEQTEEGNLLLLFSQDQSKYALATQTHIMTTLHQQRINPPDTDIRIYERSLDSAKHVFQSGLAEQGYPIGMECLILDNLQEVLSKNMPITDKIIYLRANPQVAFERAKARNGDSDKFLPKEYFDLLHQKHEELIKTLVATGKNVCIMDGHESENTIASKAAEWIKQETIVIKQVKQQKAKNKENYKEDKKEQKVNVEEDKQIDYQQTKGHMERESINRETGMLGK